MVTDWEQENLDFISKHIRIKEIYEYALYIDGVRYSSGKDYNKKSISIRNGILEEWEIFVYNGNCLHNENGPAYVYCFNGKVRNIRYYICGQLHRIDGPAATNFSKEGVIKYEGWFLNGNHHNLYGPAIRNFDSKWSNSFAIKGKNLSLDEFCNYKINHSK